MSSSRFRQAAPTSVSVFLHRTAVAIGFWGAVALPIAYLPLLTGGMTDYVGVLVVSHVACLLVGHRYEPAREQWLAPFRDGRSREVHR